MTETIHQTAEGASEASSKWDTLKDLESLEPTAGTSTKSEAATEQAETGDNTLDYKASFEVANYLNDQIDSLVAVPNKNESFERMLDELKGEREELTRINEYSKITKMPFEEVVQLFDAIDLGSMKSLASVGDHETVEKISKSHSNREMVVSMWKSKKNELDPNSSYSKAAALFN